ncbi:hypothetical protein [Pararhizobium sp. LjRoot238]|uniref:hypothetical protein n=1 Tax=Pararhizobium sp. LjRoot238 TaxID=3342293 RepID=UPI003ECE46E1
MTVNPRKFIDDIGAGGEEAKTLFMEYAEEMPGTRSCVISRHLPRSCVSLPIPMKIRNPPTSSSKKATILWERLLRGRGQILNRGVAWRVLNAVEREWKWPEIENLIGALTQPEKERYTQDAREIAAGGRLSF